MFFKSFMVESKILHHEGHEGIEAVIEFLFSLALCFTMQHANGTMYS